MPDEPDSAVQPAPRRPRADVRRRQLLDLAARQINLRGAVGLEIADLAREAGVTRPVVYRLFPSRGALLQALLDDFAEELSRRSREALPSLIHGDLSEITQAFVSAFCDTIELKGKGAFHLMFAWSPEPEVSKIGREAVLRIVGPFLPELGRMTGRNEAEAVHLLEVLVAAGRTGVDGWLEGPLDRATATRVASRAVTALMVEFSKDRVADGR